MAVITTVELFKWDQRDTTQFDDEGIATSVRTKLFGELVKLAFPILKEYHGDLYHDAMWLEYYLHGTDHFFYAIDSHGTHMGREDHYLQHRKELQLSVTVHKQDNIWYADILTLDS